MLIDPQGEPISEDPWLYPIQPGSDEGKKEKNSNKIPSPESLAEYSVLPLNVWKEWALPDQTRFLKLRDKKGLLIEGDITYAEFLTQLGETALVRQFTLLVIRVETFKDGRVFSLIRRLREQAEYRGELRITGEFLTDQLHFLKRCGADSFVLGERDDPADIKKLLSPFSHDYQNLPPA